MTKQLLIETMAFRPSTAGRSAGMKLIESAEGGKLIARGLFALADVPTANGRVYPRALWVREIARLKEAMAAGRVFGEADHPADGRTKLTRVACILRDLELMENGEVIGTSEVIGTTNGKEIKAIVEAGGEIGVSSRGYGSVSKDAKGNDLVEDDFQLDTFDFVVDPAQGEAYPEFTAESKTKPEDQMIKEDADKKADPVVVDGEKKEAVEPKEEPKAEADDKKDDDAAKDAVKNQIEQAVARAKAELRTEVESALLSDPKVAGARAALESVKQVLRPFILDKDVNATLEEKDTRIKALEEQVVALTAQHAKAKVENTALSKAVKDLGFRFYVSKTLAGHPKLESLLQSFGDLTLVEDIKALEKLVAPHKDGLKVVRTEEVEGSRKLIASKDSEIKRLSESLKTANDANKKAVAERNEAMKSAHDVSLRLYLERKVVGNPRASQIRMKFKEMKEKSKDSIDGLVEAFSAAPQRSSGDFNRIRNRLRPQTRPSATLVEDSIGDTGSRPENEAESMMVMEGVHMDPATINRLAGIK